MSSSDLKEMSTPDLVDQFGRLSEIASAADDKKKEIREQLIFRGLSGVILGSRFTLTATKTTSNRLDFDAIKKTNPKLAKQLEKYRVEGTSMTFRVKANPPSFVSDDV